MTRKPVQKKGRHFTWEEKHQIIQEMIANGCSKREIWEKYTGQVEEHGQLLRWMKKLGYPTKEKPLSVTLERKEIQMPRKRKSKQESIADEESFENLQLDLDNRIQEKNPLLVMILILEYAISLVSEEIGGWFQIKMEIYMRLLY